MALSGELPIHDLAQVGRQFLCHAGMLTERRMHGSAIAERTVCGRHIKSIEISHALLLAFAHRIIQRRSQVGETLEYGEFYHHIGLGYNADIRVPHRNQGTVSHGVSLWGFRAMLMNPFSVKGYSIETEDLSALAPNTQHAEMRDFRQMLILNFHCNLDFGTQRRDSGKRINNEDKENGILSGTK